MIKNKGVITKKPWGSEECWAHTENYVGKTIRISKGHRLSLQFHKEKKESIIVLSGVLTLILNNTKNTLLEGQCVDIHPGVIHRMEANIEDVVLIEVSTPETMDIVRLEDDYNRSSDS
jgi:quercetin dioxygenase-like cupin family protein